MKALYLCDTCGRQIVLKSATSCCGYPLRVLGNVISDSGAPAGVSAHASTPTSTPAPVVEHEKTIVSPVGAGRWAKVNESKKKRKGEIYKSKAEEEYAAYLGTRLDDRIITKYDYEITTLKTGDGRRYTADFTVEDEGPRIQLHEVKGTAGERLDATGSNKFRTALEFHRKYIWVMAKKVKGGGWNIEIFE